MKFQLKFMHFHKKNSICKCRLENGVYLSRLPCVKVIAWFGTGENCHLNQRRPSTLTHMASPPKWVGYNILWKLYSMCHDDVIKWKHFPRYWPSVRSPGNTPHKGLWRGAFMFSLICASIKDWANNREAGDLRRHRDHYDVTVIRYQKPASIMIYIIYLILISSLNKMGCLRIPVSRKSLSIT